jgi:hypothetical protein
VRSPGPAEFNRNLSSEVDRAYQRLAAVDAVRYLLGVSGVSVVDNMVVTY